MDITTPIDLALYAKAPQFSVHRGISLAGVLLDYLPDPANEAVEYRAAQLREVRDEAREAVRVRHRELGPSVVARHVALDRLVDTLNQIRFERLGQWVALDCDALRDLAEQQRRTGEAGPVDWVALLDKARQAQHLSALLFPAGIDYVRASFEEQDEHMQTVADLIAEDGCRPLLDALVDPELLAGLDVARAEYRQMVRDRLAHARGSAIDLRTIVARLQGAIQGYMIAVLSLLRDHDPASAAVVRRALRPVDAVREQFRLDRQREAGKSVEPSDPEVLDELVAAERALGLELGLLDPATDTPPTQPGPSDA